MQYAYRRLIISVLMLIIAIAIYALILYYFQQKIAKIYLDYTNKLKVSTQIVQAIAQRRAIENSIKLMKEKYDIDPEKAIKALSSHLTYLDKEKIKKAFEMSTFQFKWIRSSSAVAPTVEILLKSNQLLDLFTFLNEKRIYPEISRMMINKEGDDLKVTLYFEY